MGLRQRIAQAIKLPREELWLEEIGEKVFVREMTGAEYDAYQTETLGRAGKDGKLKNVNGLRAKLIQMCLLDEDGAQVYDAKSIDEIQSLPTTVIDKICEVASRINNLNNESDEALEKNLEEGDGSGSSIPLLCLSGEPVTKS